MLAGSWTAAREEKAFLLAAGCRSSQNRELLRIFKKEQDYFVRLSWHDDVLFPQQAVQENVGAMDRAIACLENRNLPGALESGLYNRQQPLCILFEEEVYTYFTEYVLNQPPGRSKWGRQGRRIVPPSEPVSPGG